MSRNGLGFVGDRRMDAQNALENHGGSRAQGWSPGAGEREQRRCLSGPRSRGAEAARVLRDGGHLLVADFAPHEDEDLRALAAHARLGFSDTQIGGWFAASGLTLERTQTLEGGALAVKLWLGARRRDQDQPPVAAGDGEGKRLAA